MPLKSPALRRFVTDTLLATTGVRAPTATQLASAFDTLCDRLRTKLHPMFGATAVNALFARAHRVAVAEFPWLIDIVPIDGAHCSAAGVIAAAVHVDAGTLADALAAVLASDIELLTTFIGGDLVVPLVEDAWRVTSLSDRLKTEGYR